MNNKLLLINALTLLIRESQLSDRSANYKPVELIREIMQDIRGPVTESIIDHETRMVNELKAMVMEMLSHDETVEYSLNEILQKVQVITEPDPNLFEAFRDNILIELEEEEIKKVIVRLTRSFKKHFKDKAVKSIINRYAATVRFRPEEIGDMGKFISQMVTELEPYQNSLNDKDPAVVDSVNFEDLESITKIYDRISESKEGGLAFLTGWQGLNRMLDGVGIRRNECLLLEALEGKNKSGITRSLFQHFCVYNKPHFLTRRKKAMLMYLSFEDNSETIFSWFYRHLKEQETGVKVTKDELATRNSAEKALYVRSKLMVNGFVPYIERINPSDWTYQDIQNKVLSMEAEGYEVMALFLDYLSMVPTTGCITGPSGVDIRDMFRRMRNFTSSRNIALITPHQLSPDAKLLQRDEVMDFARKVAGGGYTSGSKQICQELDTEIAIHIEKVDGVSYQTFALGKRRDGEIIPDKDRHFALRFHDIGGIPPDIGGVDTTLPKPGALSQAQVEAGGEQPFFLAGTF